MRGGRVGPPLTPSRLAAQHGVVVVGYGTDEETGYKYWHVRNSWGTGWGMQGYAKLARGRRWPPGGICGIVLKASYPVF